MELDVLLRGQSNAYFLDFFGGTARIEQQVNWLLGFDGVNQKVNVIADYNGGAGGPNSIVSFTSVLNDWMVHNADGTWSAGTLENGLLADIANHPELQANATAVVWLHNENDSMIPGLTAATWEAAVRADAALVRQALGQDAPYLFVNAIPYQYADPASNQQIKLGMEDLAADPNFHGLVAAHIGDVNMDTDGTGFGGPHMNQIDVTNLADRLSRSIAETFQQYAAPNSVIALSGGNVDNLGPHVGAAMAVTSTELLLSVVHDNATGFLPLDADAQHGVGWSIQGADGSFIAATGAQLVDATHIDLTFGAAMPAGGVLHYEYGNGRLVGADGTGQGHAIYDDQWLPIWTPAAGVAIDNHLIA